MFEEVYFQFPKLGFLLFVFLGCEALCPLRSNPLYFPQTARFGSIGVKSPLWIWMSKWAMVTLLIIAVMSPVREHPINVQNGGYDILIVVDPAAADPKAVKQIEEFIAKRTADRIGLWVPDAVESLIPMTQEHDVLISMLRQVTKGLAKESVSRNINRFFADSAHRIQWVVIVSNEPKTFVYSLPTGVQTSIVSPSDQSDWVSNIDSDHPQFEIFHTGRYFDFYYIYPLFLGFLAMLVYLYGRNQKGIR